MTQNLKICRFTSENFKRLKAVDITPGKDQNILKITGKNEAGKSSVLDGIWAILEWAEAKKQIPRPIRTGATSAVNTVDLGDITVTRTWTAGGSYLTVANKQGAIYRSPQAVLDALKGQLSFDPLEFAHMNADAQKALFMRITGLGVKIQTIETNKQLKYEERTSVNREIRDLIGRQRIAEQSGAKAVAEDPAVPENEVQVTELMAAIGRAQTTVNANNRKRQYYQTTKEALDKDLEEIRQLEDDLKHLQQTITMRQDRYRRQQNVVATLATEAETLKDPDLEGMMQEANGVDDTNRKVRAKRQYLEISNMIAAKQKAVADLEADMAEYDKQKEDIFKTAKMPIDGLSVGPEGVLYKDIPFAQCSQAEKLRVSTAIAMALNPSLRVIRITDGSLLDSANMAELERLAQENDYQIWIETVDESGKVGVYIEDGEVKTMAEEPAEALHEDKGLPPVQKTRPMPPVKEPRKGTEGKK